MHNTIIVCARMDAMGSIIVRPVSDKHARHFQRAVVANGGPNDIDVYLQEGDPASEFLEQDVPPRYRRDLEHGWTVRWRVDPWIVGHWYGWDAAEA